MDVIVERCAGLDVHRDSVVATVRVPGKGKSRRRRAQRTRTFATTIAQLEQLADWLEGFGVTLVGMEATGVYWKPVFWVLERRFECWLINAEHLHNVPGRKSDVIDSRWCCELLELGLVRPSFVPPPEIRRLRDLTRLRSTQVEERTRAIQRLEKVLQDAGIKLTSVASGTYSVSARAILEALLGGVSDPAGSARISVYRWVVRCCRGRGLRSGCVGLPLRSSSCNRFASSSWRAVSRARSAAARRRRWGSVLWSCCRPRRR